jgi:SAM-dependent methyltransferase
MTNRTAETIKDFGAQWTRFTDNSGYYGSVELLKDIISPLVDTEELRNTNVADIGSGTGRIVNMLLDAGVRSVVAVEPSEAFDVLKKNTVQRAERITYLRVRGDQLPKGQDLDFIVSLGVIHHIPDPAPTMQAIFQALKPGGEVVLWLYGREGNENYLAVALPLRAIARLLPDRLLLWFSSVLDYALDPYIWLARRFQIPMQSYFLEHYAKLSRSKRRLTVFDQLNPAYAKYYTRKEAEALVSRAGFEDIRLFHRHGYSWTVRARKPILPGDIRVTVH